MRGLGLRSREDLASAAFAACFIESAERFIDIDRGGGVIRRGIFPMLHRSFGAGSFDSPTSGRFATYLHPNRPVTRTSIAFRIAWQSMQAEMTHHVPGPLGLTVEQAGADRGRERLQRSITAQREQLRFDILQRRVMMLPEGDGRREAWLAVDRFSSAFVTSWPSERDEMSSEEFREVLTTYLGVDSPVCQGLEGRSIPDTLHARVCDRRGVQLGLACLPGRAHGECHDSCSEPMWRDVQAAGITVETQPSSLFAQVLPPAQMYQRPTDDEQRPRRIGCIPDAHIRLRMHEARTERLPRGQRGVRRTTVRRGQLMSERGTLWDAKTIHIGGPSYRSARARGLDGQSGAVADRAHAVDRDYQRTARSKDQILAVQNFNGGRTDAVLSTLRSFGTVRSAVWGGYAEASDDVHQLLDEAATAAAQHLWRYMGARSAAEARGYFVGRLVRSWGVNAARAFARHRLSRTCLVGLTRDQLPTRTVHRGYGGPGDAAWDLRQPSEFLAHIDHIGGRAGGGGNLRRL